MTRLLLVPGSQRAASLNAGLLRELASRLAGRCELDFLEAGQVRLPLFDQDLEDHPVVVAQVAALHRRFNACHGIVVASPEYNGQLPPFLKNLIDWVSRLPHIDGRFNNPFIDRPVLLCSASTGASGGAAAIPSARALFGYLGANVLGETVCIPYAQQAWTGDGYLFDPVFDEQLTSATDRLLRWAGSQALSPAAATA